MRYRKKPVVVEAVQLRLDGPLENARAVLETIGATPGHFDMPLVEGRACWWRQDSTTNPPTFTLVIHTDRGEMEARDGDWIIRGVEGELYPCTDSVFRATYEPAQ